MHVYSGKYLARNGREKSVIIRQRFSRISLVINRRYSSLQSLDVRRADHNIVHQAIDPIISTSHVIISVQNSRKSGITAIHTPRLHIWVNLSFATLLAVLKKKCLIKTRLPLLLKQKLDVYASYCRCINRATGPREQVQYTGYIQRRRESRRVIRSAGGDDEGVKCL